MKIQQIGVLAAAMAFAGAAMADNHRSTAEKIQKLDTDGDGRVSQAEFTAMAVADFTRIDTNSDGFVTAAEMDAYKAAEKARGADKDKDKDSYKDKDMHKEMHQQMHKEMDHSGHDAQTMPRSTTPVNDQPTTPPASTTPPTPR